MQKEPKKSRSAKAFARMPSPRMIPPAGAGIFFPPLALLVYAPPIASERK